MQRNFENSVYILQSSSRNSSREPNCRQLGALCTLNINHAKQTQSIDCLIHSESLWPKSPNLARAPVRKLWPCYARAQTVTFPAWSGGWRAAKSCVPRRWQTAATIRYKCDAPAATATCSQHGQIEILIADLSLRPVFRTNGRKIKSWVLHCNHKDNLTRCRRITRIRLFGRVFSTHHDCSIPRCDVRQFGTK